VYEQLVHAAAHEAHLTATQAPPDLRNHQRRRDRAGWLLLGDYGGSFTLTLVNYRALLHQAGQIGPLERSLIYMTIVSFVTVIGGFVAAWLLSQRARTRSTKALDFLLLAAIALPSVVFAAGYICSPSAPSSRSCRSHICSTRPARHPRPSPSKTI
jgi:ABC-type glycerol-3-phosphate transport system permease component